jgi:hypothetical protein
MLIKLGEESRVAVEPALVSPTVASLPRRLISQFRVRGSLGPNHGSVGGKTELDPGAHLAHRKGDLAGLHASDLRSLGLLVFEDWRSLLPNDS